MYTIIYIYWGISIAMFDYQMVSPIYVPKSLDTPIISSIRIRCSIVNQCKPCILMQATLMSGTISGHLDFQAYAALLHEATGSLDATSHAGCSDAAGCTHASLNQFLELHPFDF